MQTNRDVRVDGQEGRTRPFPERAARLLRRVIQQTAIARISLTTCKDETYSTVTVERDSPRCETRNPEPSFCIGSIAKLLINMVTVELAAQRRLNLDAPIATYLPELATSPQAQHIRICHLLSHTSGFQPLGSFSAHHGTGFTWADFVRFFSASPQLFLPGTVFNYNDSDHVLVSQILTRTMECSTLRLLNEQIFSQLGIPVSAQPALCEPDNVAAAALSLAHMRMSTQSLIALSRAIMGRCRRDNGERILDGATLLMRQVIAIPSLPRRHTKQYVWHHETPVSFGLGCAAYADGSFGHPGSSSSSDQCCAIRFNPARGVAVAVGMDARATRVRDGLVTTILRLLLDDHAGPDAPLVPTCSDCEPGAPWSFGPGELEGSYIGARDDLQITVSETPDGVLLTMINPVTAVRRLFPFKWDDLRCPLPAGSADAAHLPLSFFRDPGSGTPCVMYGWRAFKRNKGAP